VVRGGHPQRGPAVVGPVSAGFASTIDGLAAPFDSTSQIMRKSMPWVVVAVLALV
jgi:hypothetical protein